MSGIDIEAIRAQHTGLEFSFSGGGSELRCYADNGLWPCATIALCDEVERLRRGLQYARDNGPCTGFGNCAWHDGIDAALNGPTQ